AEIGRPEDEYLEALWSALVTSPRPWRYAHHVPLRDLDDLVVELHSPAPAHHQVNLLLLLMRVAVREAVRGRDALIPPAGRLEPKRLACAADLEARRAAKVGPPALQTPLGVPGGERHGAHPTVLGGPSRVSAPTAGGATLFPPRCRSRHGRCRPSASSRDG